MARRLSVPIAGVLLPLWSCTADYDALETAMTSASSTGAAADGGSDDAGAGGAPLETSGPGASGGRRGVGGQEGPGGAGDSGVASSGRGGAGGGGGSAGGGGGPPPPSSCLAQYGAAPSYEGCSETESTCMFYATGISCAAFCTAAGGKCETVYNQGPPADHCGFALRPTFDCMAVYGDMICVCTNGCGGADPCAPGTVCDGTSCV